MQLRQHRAPPVRYCRFCGRPMPFNTMRRPRAGVATPSAPAQSSLLFRSQESIEAGRGRRYSARVRSVHSGRRAAPAAGRHVQYRYRPRNANRRYDHAPHTTRVMSLHRVDRIE
ncbi:hypothetical protein BS78_07G194500 [Paspalum vaginatum]|nr:hypothetical protein BS78_07G194500 [Paspalum vaginatum]